MADHDSTGPPGYPLEDTLDLDRPDQYRALFEETRLRIIDLLSERAATTSQVADVLGRPKGTIGHHLGVLAEAGLIRVVRTEKVRAIEAKYYGRTARWFNLEGRKMRDLGILPHAALAEAMEELARAPKEGYPPDVPGISTARYARIPLDRAAEWGERLEQLADEFVSEPRGGDVVFGLAVALYPTDRPHLPDEQ